MFEVYLNKLLRKNKTQSEKIIFEIKFKRQKNNKKKEGSNDS